MDKKYSVVVMTEGDDHPKTFSISKNLFKSIVVMVIVLIVSSIGFYIYIIPKYHSFEKISGEHEQLINERMKIASLLNDLKNMREMNNYFQQALGIDVDKFEDSNDTVSAEFEEMGVSYFSNVPSYTPFSGFVTRGFQQDLDRYEEDHFGIDVAGPEGSGIHSAAYGQVVFSGWTNYFGNYIIIFHGNDYFTFYGHNMRNLIERGQIVERGNLIALLGNTGKTTGPHLHFEIWNDGQPVNPIEYIVEYRNTFSSVDDHVE
tara:strand:- start:13582 stop:14361 length:780 start_codon:yes stop_codon:yes gene_type:complete